MANDIVGFRRKDAIRVGRATQIVERSPRFSEGADRGYRAAWTGTQIAKTKAGGIAKMTGTTPAKADVVFYDLDGDDLVEGETVEVRNNWKAVIAANTWIHVTVINGVWFVTAEDC